MLFLRPLMCSNVLRKNILPYKRTGGTESRTQVLASYCSSDVIDPGSHTHISPEASRGILGLRRHMTNCSALFYKHISVTSSYQLFFLICLHFFLTQLGYLKDVTLILYGLPHILQIACTFHYCHTLQSFRINLKTLNLPD